MRGIPHAQHSQSPRVTTSRDTHTQNPLTAAASGTRRLPEDKASDQHARKDPPGRRPRSKDQAARYVPSVTILARSTDEIKRRSEPSAPRPARLAASSKRRVILPAATHYSNKTTQIIQTIIRRSGRKVEKPGRRPRSRTSSGPLRAKPRGDEFSAGKPGKTGLVKSRTCTHLVAL